MPIDHALVHCHVARLHFADCIRRLSCDPAEQAMTNPLITNIISTAPRVSAETRCLGALQCSQPLPVDPQHYGTQKALGLTCVTGLHVCCLQHCPSASRLPRCCCNCWLWWWHDCRCARPVDMHPRVLLTDAASCTLATMLLAPDAIQRGSPDGLVYFRLLEARC